MNDFSKMARDPAALKELLISSKKMSRGSSRMHVMHGSLPMDIRASDTGVEWVPAALFGPAHLTAKQRTSPFIQEQHSVKAELSDARLQAVSSAELISAAGSSPFLQHTEAMLSPHGGGGGTLSSQFTDNTADVSYDFDEYVLLRNPEEPYALGLNNGSPTVSADPRFQLFRSEAERGISSYVNYISLRLTYNYQLNSNMIGLRQVLTSWWFDVCAVRAFNRLGRYSRSDIKDITNGLTPEEYYGWALDWKLSNAAFTEGFNYLARNGSTAALGKLLTIAFWEEVLNDTFQEFFDGNGVRIVEPTAPKGEYSFEPYPYDEVFVGVRVIHRQNWRLLGYGRGELVKSIPLGPKESQKISVKVTQRSKQSRSSESASSYETTSETSSTTKDSSEVVAEATEKLNRHAEAEVGGGYGPFIQAKVSGGLSQDLGSSSKDTKTRLNEIMEKTSSRMKRDTKITVSTESERMFEETRSSEIVNPNDEIAVTYLYHKLQQRYWVSTEIAEVHSVVFVPEPVPDWEHIDEVWVLDHSDVIADALLDTSFAPVLAAIRKEPENLTYASTNIFSEAANAGIHAAKSYINFTGGGAMPDLLASGQLGYEKDFERRNNLAMDQARRKHQLQSLLTHIRRNILHYMRAIWASEDYDQRMQRYSRMRVPVEWYFVPQKSGQGPLETEGVFMPKSGSMRPLTEIIDPIGPIGYLLNCAIYKLRDDPKLANMHQALAYLRSTYTRFRVDISVSDGAGFSIRQHTVHTPRSFQASYTWTYRASRQKWLIPVPGRTEMDWIEVKTMPDGSLDAVGIRIWVDGTPADGATLSINLNVTSDLEDPHLRRVQLQHPLPSVSEEEGCFTDTVLHEMKEMFTGLTDVQRLTWSQLTEEEKDGFRKHYHLYLMLRESGRLVTLDTANIVLDLEVSQTPALESFKRLHRYLDVMKEYQELQRRELDNIRREKLLQQGVYSDPDIERVTLINGNTHEIAAATDTPEE